MVQVVFSPKWFWGKDIFIDAIALLVLLSIAIFATKYYRIKKSRNYLYLALSFYLIALSFLSKILINFTIYYQVLHTQVVGSIKYTQVVLKSSEILAISGLFFYRFFTLLGLFLLYSIYEKKQSKANIILMAYFIIISIFFSKEEYYIFYLTSFIFLGIISNRYFQNYRKRKSKASGMLAISFSVITLSQIFFMFVNFTKHFYVVGEVIQLIGYIVLLVAFVTVLKHGREKDKG